MSRQRPPTWCLYLATLNTKTFVRRYCFSHIPCMFHRLAPSTKEYMLHTFKTAVQVNIENCST